MLHILDQWESIKLVFLFLIPRNSVKVTFVDLTEESTSKSVESTFETLIIEIDVRLYQYSCVDSSKWQEMAKNYWHKHKNYHSGQLNEFTKGNTTLDGFI